MSRVTSQAGLALGVTGLKRLETRFAHSRLTIRCRPGPRRRWKPPPVLGIDLDIELLLETAEILTEDIVQKAGLSPGPSVFEIRVLVVERRHGRAENFENHPSAIRKGGRPGLVIGDGEHRSRDIGGHDGGSSITHDGVRMLHLQLVFRSGKRTQRLPPSKALIMPFALAVSRLATSSVCQPASTVARASARVSWRAG